MKPKCLIIRENNKFINPLLFVLLFSEYNILGTKVMQEEEYTFVTLDGNDVMPADAVIIDVEGGGVDLGDAIVIDDSSIESFDHSDFITLADDTVMLSDTDMMDLYSTDMDGADISFIV